MKSNKTLGHNEMGKSLNTVAKDKREYPILFDTEMIQSIVSGRKTVTRRIFRSPLSKAMEPAAQIYHENGRWLARLKNEKLLDYPVYCPYGQPGDVLWVKETMNHKGQFKADLPPNGKHTKPGWIPSIHMPRHKARLWLQITDVKAQRIQSVTEEEAWEEGTKPGKIYGFGEMEKNTFREGFIAKWISVYGIESYYENPWVWAI